MASSWRAQVQWLKINTCCVEQHWILWRDHSYGPWVTERFRHQLPGFSVNVAYCVFVCRRLARFSVYNNSIIINSEREKWHESGFKYRIRAHAYSQSEGSSSPSSRPTGLCLTWQWYSQLSYLQGISTRVNLSKANTGQLRSTALVYCLKRPLM